MPSCIFCYYVVLILAKESSHEEAQVPNSVKLTPKGDHVPNKAELIQAAMECPQSVKVKVPGLMTCGHPRSEMFTLHKEFGAIFYSSPNSKDSIFSTVDLFLQKISGVSEKVYTIGESIGSVLTKAIPALAGASVLAGAGRVSVSTS